MQRPVAALGKNNVQIAILINVAKAHAGGGFTLGFQQKDSIKGTEFP